jgi:hypothetical protein
MKKIALLSMVLVLVLGSLGVAYAMWSDKLTLGGTINTDDVCVMFTDDFSSDDPCTPEAPYGQIDHTVNANHDYLLGTKDVGCTTVTKENDNTLVVTLNNVYPCYAVKIDSHVRNCGSVPVVKDQCTITYVPDPQTGVEVTVPLPDYQWTTIMGPGKEGGMGADGTFGVYEIMWGNGTGDQLDPHSWEGVGDEEDSFYIHVLQPALQNHEYTFTITRLAWNWNE